MAERVEGGVGSVARALGTRVLVVVGADPVEERGPRGRTDRHVKEFRAALLLITPRLGRWEVEDARVQLANVMFLELVL